ncbi:MAG: DUF354 domain-containing protein [Desulfurococcales archaeon]|nr:DUF354 domain-containing protein [Desulfurococcales archaeon]
MRIKVWLDSQTSKQSTLLGFLAKELNRHGFETIITCRDYEFTAEAFKVLGLEPEVVGHYSEGDAWDKVLADVHRIKAFIDLLRHRKPDILVSYPNPAAARVAFGVGIKYLALTDSPHSSLPSRLSLPLADEVIFSEAIPTKEIKKYVTDSLTRLSTFRGVDELVWILRRRPIRKYVEGLGLKPGKYVVVRPHEEKATYYRGLNVAVDIESLIKQLSYEGYLSVILPRYRSHELLVRKLVKEGLKVIALHKGFDGLSLSFYAKAVITGGATMAREAALLMTPGITYFPLELHVNEYVAMKGYPLHKVSTTQEILDVIRNAEGKHPPYEEVREKLLRDFEDPLPRIISAIKGLAS